MKTLSVETVFTSVFDNLVSQWNENKMLLLNKIQLVNWKLRVQ